MKSVITKLVLVINAITQKLDNNSLPKTIWPNILEFLASVESALKFYLMKTVTTYTRVNFTFII